MAGMAEPTTPVSPQVLRGMVSVGLAGEELETAIKPVESHTPTVVRSRLDRLRDNLVDQLLGSSIRISVLCRQTLFANVTGRSV
jgi:hypothetical protein